MLRTSGRRKKRGGIPLDGEELNLLPLMSLFVALAVGLELFVGSLTGAEPGAVLLVARPEHDPVPVFRELAAGRRLPGDS